MRVDLEILGTEMKFITILEDFEITLHPDGWFWSAVRDDANRMVLSSFQGLAIMPMLKVYSQSKTWGLLLLQDRTQGDGFYRRVGIVELRWLHLNALKDFSESAEPYQDLLEPHQYRENNGHGQYTIALI